MTNIKAMASVMQHYQDYVEAVEATYKAFPENSFTSTDYVKAWQLSKGVCPECKKPFTDGNDYEGLCEWCTFCGKWKTILK